MKTVLTCFMDIIHAVTWILTFPFQRMFHTCIQICLSEVSLVYISAGNRDKIDSELIFTKIRRVSINYDCGIQLLSRQIERY